MTLGDRLLSLSKGDTIESGTMLPGLSDESLVYTVERTSEKGVVTMQMHWMGVRLNKVHAKCEDGGVKWRNKA